MGLKETPYWLKLSSYHGWTVNWDEYGGCECVVAAQFLTFCWQSSWTHSLDYSAHHGALRRTYGNCQWEAWCIILTEWSSETSIYVSPSSTYLHFYPHNWTLFYELRISVKPLPASSTHANEPGMPSPSDSSSVASASGSRGWSDSRRGMSGRGPGGARLLLYLGLCHLGLGAMVLAFSFTSMAFTSSARVRQSCPFWAGFFVSLTLTWNLFRK